MNIKKILMIGITKMVWDIGNIYIIMKYLLMV